MTTNGTTTTYPTWQNAIRLAQAEQAERDAKRMAVEAAKRAEEDAEHAASTRDVMDYLGIEPESVEGYVAIVGNHRFTLFEPNYRNNYSGDPRISIARVDATPYDHDLEINPPYQMVNFNWYKHRRDNDPTRAQAEIAAAIDALDDELPLYEQRVQVARNRREAGQAQPAPATKQRIIYEGSFEWRLIDLFSELFHEDRD